MALTEDTGFISWLPVLAGLSVAWLIVVLQMVLRSGRGPITRSRPDPAGRIQIGVARSLNDRVREFALRRLSWSMRLSIERKLLHAGLIRWQVTDLVLVHAGSILLAGMLAVLFDLSGWLVPVVMLMTGVLIESWVTQRQRGYSARIAMHLPGFLDMLCLCLNAGMSFNAGLLVVLRYTPDGPLRLLWRDWLFDVRAGSTRVEALTRLMNKSAQASLQRLCVAMIQAERTGAALASSLQSQSAQLRQDHLLAAERRAAQAPMRMLLPLVICFFPSTFLVLGFSIWVGVVDVL